MKDIVKKFQWKDRNDVFHYPCDMETRHIFYTLKMIWNHSVPENMKLKPYKKYRFSPFYTAKYMKVAVKCLIAELKTRNDIELYLHQMQQIQQRMEALSWHNYQLTQD